MSRRRARSAAIACLAGLGLTVAAIDFACAPVAPAAPPAAPSAAPPASSAPLPAELEVLLLVPADAISLHPRLEAVQEHGPRPGAEAGEGNESYVVTLPLPSQRTHLRRVDVWLSVTARSDGRLVHQQRQVFGRYTRGDDLRFYVAPLPGGSYLAEVRTVAQVDLVGQDGGVIVREEEDSASLEMTSHGPPARPVATTHSVPFHFQRGQASLVELDEKELPDAVKRIRFLLTQNRVARAQIDCWASSEGDRNLNWRLSHQRCAWFRNVVWDQHLRGVNKPHLDSAAHGPDNPPYEDAEGEDSAATEQNRARNRVAVLKLFVEH